MQRIARHVKNHSVRHRSAMGSADTLLSTQITVPTMRASVASSATHVQGSQARLTKTGLSRTGPEDDLDALDHESAAVPEDGHFAGAGGLAADVDQQSVVVVDGGLHGVAARTEDADVLRLRAVSWRSMASGRYQRATSTMCSPFSAPPPMASTAIVGARRRVSGDLSSRSARSVLRPEREPAGLPQADGWPAHGQAQTKRIIMKSAISAPISPFRAARPPLCFSSCRPGHGFPATAEQAKTCLDPARIR